jgi:hypothetical protein
MKTQKKYKKGVLPKSQYDKACDASTTYRGTMQRSAQKGAKKEAAMFGGGYSSYKILDQLEQM